MLTPLPALPSPPSRIHPLPLVSSADRVGYAREGGGGVEGKRVLIPVAITHRRRLVAFNKNVNMAA